MQRRLSPEEAKLWRQVAGTVRAYKQLEPLTMAMDSAVKAPSRPLKTKAMPVPDAPMQTAPKAKTQHANTLDAGWDRKLSRGMIIPDRTVDLHGYGLSAAHVRLNQALSDAVVTGARVILLITGRAQRDNPRMPPTSRGVIRASVGDWLAASPHADQIAAIRNAHPRHGGAGALYLIMRRPR
jgi:DNA-nicking Smr family endonuclease